MSFFPGPFYGRTSHPSLKTCRVWSQLVMHGDIIEFNGMECEVAIQGGEGTYCRDESGYAVNIAQGNEGFLRDVNKEGATQFRAQWSDRTRVIRRKHPHLFGGKGE